MELIIIIAGIFFFFLIFKIFTSILGFLFKIIFSITIIILFLTFINYFLGYNLF